MYGWTRARGTHEFSLLALHPPRPWDHTMNLSTSPTSVSFGRDGAKQTISRRGDQVIAGIPGTGLFYTVWDRDAGGALKRLGNLSAASCMKSPADWPPPRGAPHAKTRSGRLWHRRSHPLAGFYTTVGTRHSRSASHRSWSPPTDPRSPRTWNPRLYSTTGVQAVTTRDSEEITPEASWLLDARTSPSTNMNGKPRARLHIATH